MTVSEKLNAISREKDEAIGLAPYSAVNGLWICLVKISNCVPTVGEEHEQMLSVLRKLSRDQAAAICVCRGVDVLLELAPPLETMLVDERERLQPLQAARELAKVRERRQSDPKAALAALFEIVQRIRDKREHGFKTPDGPRDVEILSAAAEILSMMVNTTIVEVANLEGPRTQSLG
jgi:hypothetical protein